MNESILKNDKDDLQMDKVLYREIKEVYDQISYLDEWISYGQLFSAIKPKLVEAIGARVWSFRTFLEIAVTKGEVSKKERDNEVYYKKNKEVK